MNLDKFGAAIDRTFKLYNYFASIDIIGYEQLNVALEYIKEARQVSHPCLARASRPLYLRCLKGPALLSGAFSPHWFKGPFARIGFLLVCHGIWPKLE